MIAACDPAAGGPGQAGLNEAGLNETGADGAGAGGFDLVIAADGGVDIARRLGRAVDLVVGDLDSASAAGLDWARSAGARIERHPAAKNETDLELALARACAEAAAVHVVGSLRGRVDHSWTGLAVLASDRWAQSVISASIDGARVDVVRGRRALGGGVGELLSLMAVGGVARVTATGLEYRIDGGLLDPAEARGVSNVIVDPPPIVEVSAGVVLAVRPLAAPSGRGDA